MNDRHRPLPLRDVLDIVERRRRLRARRKAIAAPAAAAGAAGITCLVVVVLQLGPDPVTPAAPATALTPQPTVPTSAVDPALGPYLRPGYLEELALTVAEMPDDTGRTRVADTATQLQQAWGLEFYPAAKAVAVKAELTGTELDATDPDGDDALVSRFEAAGYTDADAAALAAAWGTDPHTAKVLGALLPTTG